MVRLEVFSLYSPSLVSPFIRLQIVVRVFERENFHRIPQILHSSLYTKHRYTTVERLRSIFRASYQTGAREAHFEKR